MSRAAGVHLGSVLGAAVAAILVTAEGDRSAAAQTPPSQPPVQAPGPAATPQVAQPQPGTAPVPAAPPPPPPFAPAPPPGYPPPAVHGGAPPQAPPGGYPPAYPPPPPGANYPPPAPGYGYGYGYGAPGYGAYPPPRAPAPPPESMPGYHRHDGFFLRLALGLGVFVDHERPENYDVFPSTRLSNAAVPLEIALGGAVSNGLLLGGVLLFNGVGSPKFDNGGEGSPWQGSSGVTHSSLGVYVDDYPMAASGFHFGGLVALSGLGKSGDRVGGNDPATGGFSIAAHGGYEWWVGADWGMGVMGRILFSELTSDQHTTTLSYTDRHTVWIPSVMATVTYN